MPYANFDDVNALQAVYNNYLQEENDMNVFEFIGEKILSAGFVFDTNQQKNNSPKHHSTDNTAMMQIQIGVMFRHLSDETIIPVFTPQKIAQPLINLMVASQDFYPGIFHPPLITA